jgi:hypothetical protein
MRGYVTDRSGFAPVLRRPYQVHLIPAVAGVTRLRIRLYTVAGPGTDPQFAAKCRSLALRGMPILGYER